MFERAGVALLCALTVTSPALADPFMLPISIAAGPLPAGLQNLERQTGIELLYDASLIHGLQSPQVLGPFTSETALLRLLSQTNLTIRRASSGAWVIEQKAAPPLAQQDAAVSEILVVGRRTQNADIRRINNDVQPYTVVTREEIVAAHRDNIDQYFASRVSANTQVIPNSLAQSSDPTSEIDLRGLGSGSTLVLIDGRRMPRNPYLGDPFSQSDLNAIPLHSIERIEILTGAAGGIYGFGTLGGVVNVILDRSNRGFDLHATEGISSRGDAHRQGIEANFGHTSASETTDLVLSAAHSESDPLLAGERNFAVRDRRRAAELLDLSSYWDSYPHGNSITVRGSGSNLVFKPEFGGATLSSDYTFLPAGFSGDAAALAAALTAGTGRLDFSLADGAASSYLMSKTRSDALLMNLRHRFGAGVEGYADALVLRSRGRSQEVLDLYFAGYGSIAAQSPANPFTESVDVAFPVEGLGYYTSSRIESTRYIAGLMTELPLSWRGTAEASWGSFRYSSSFSTPSFREGYLLLLGAPSDLDMNPLGNWQEFQKAVSADPIPSSNVFTMRNRFRAESLRLAGPVFTTAAGPATLTLLAEHRKEHIPTTTEIDVSEVDGVPTEFPLQINPFRGDTKSLYTELRAPLTRKLELQLAVRHDVEHDEFARYPDGVDDGGTVKVNFAGTAYTLGVKVQPTEWLMLRGSYATGDQPPNLLYLREDDDQDTPFGPVDPKRGDTLVGEDGAYVYKSGGNPDLDTVHANTTFLGAVLTPFGADGPRFSLDFSHILRRKDAVLPYPDILLAHENLWPERIVRAPLTAADRAQGYTAGRILLLDARAINAAGRKVNALDVHAEWPTMLLTGRLRLYAEGTYQMRNLQTELFQDDVERAGYREGPLKWRANGGFEWSGNRLTIGVNAQYFGRYLVLNYGPEAGANEFNRFVQGSRRIPAQAYLDLHTSWRVPQPRSDPVNNLTLDFGLINVFDTSPPRVSSLIDDGPGYSRYGDPRQRRVELVLSCRF